MDWNLDVIAIVATVIIALIAGYFRRRSGLDGLITEQMKLLLTHKDKEITALRGEVETLRNLVDAQLEKINALESDKTNN